MNLIPAGIPAEQVFAELRKKTKATAKPKRQSQAIGVFPVLGSKNMGPKDGRPGPGS